jgi:hypothetical protein
MFDRPSLQPLLTLTLTDLHFHTLTFCQAGHSVSRKGRGVDENILAAPILPYDCPINRGTGCPSVSTLAAFCERPRFHLVAAHVAHRQPTGAMKRSK